MGTEHPQTTGGPSPRWHLLPLMVVFVALIASFVRVGAPAISEGERIDGPSPGAEDPRRVPATGLLGRVVWSGGLPPGPVGTLVDLPPA